MRLNNKNLQLISDVSMIISNALAEDIGADDITCKHALIKRSKIKAVITSKDKNIVVCGLDIIKEVFAQVDSNTKVIFHVKEGCLLRNKSKVCTIYGDADSVLKAERTALNFLGRLSGIATLTKVLADKIKKYKVVLLDTRKTTPGMRVLEKYAVKVGGGKNHRKGLFDQILIKDNHIKIIKKNFSGLSLCDIIKRTRNSAASEIVIEIEVTNISELKDALSGNPDVIMLDNMSLALMKKAVFLRDKTNKNIMLEASGNITGSNIESVAKCQVDYISIGSLTHSVMCSDFSLNVK